MSEHLLFLTGKLAEPSLHRVLEGMQPTDFSYTVLQLGVNVAALMTADMIKRRLKDTQGADRVILPGHCRGDLIALREHFGIPFDRGPKELKDLPAYFGHQALAIDLSQYDVQIFAEIVDAPNMSIDEILAQAQRYRRDGANVIDIGCLPATPFPHLVETITALKESGFKVSVDSLELDDLLAGGRAGADYLLSLKEDTLWVAEEVAATPILIPANSGDLDSLQRAAEQLLRKGRPCIADPILDPIHTGFVDSILRYRELRRRMPEVEMMMGIGNLTELTHADTAGSTALLMGMISEMGITHVLTTEVSAHCRSVVRETDRARRLMFAARRESTPPRLIDDGLMTVHERDPFPYDLQEIEETAAAIRDPSFRIQISVEGIHVYNRDGIHSATDPYDLFPKLGVETDGAHAFYLGFELAHAQLGFRLGKRYVQDEGLNWAYAEPEQKQSSTESLAEYAEAKSTLKAKREKK